MICNVIPYEGNDPFVFFSYCHDDADVVYPMIEYLSDMGYRIWYDTGIHPGGNWPEIIANHLSECSICISAISSAFSKSHNCRNELNFVLENNTMTIPVILEEFQMSLGMQLELSSLQQLRVYECTDFHDLLNKISKTPGLEQCKEIREEYIDGAVMSESNDAKNESEVSILLSINCLETGERIILDEFPFLIGRGNPWPRGTMADKRVSRSHGAIIVEKGEYVFKTSETTSTNGTLLNGTLLKENECFVLNDEDELEIGRVYHLKLNIIEAEDGKNE